MNLFLIPPPPRLLPVTKNIFLILLHSLTINSITFFNQTLPLCNYIVPKKFFTNFKTYLSFSLNSTTIFFHLTNAKNLMFIFFKSSISPLLHPILYYGKVSTEKEEYHDSTYQKQSHHILKRSFSHLKNGSRLQIYYQTKTLR